MANYPGQYAYPAEESRWGLGSVMDIGPRTPPPPVNYPGQYAYPAEESRWGLGSVMDMGPSTPPPPVNYPGQYAYPAEQSRWELGPVMDIGLRLPVFQEGNPRGSTNAPYSANCRGLFKRIDRKVKPL